MAVERIELCGDLIDKDDVETLEDSRGQYFKSIANVFVEGEESGLFYGYQTDGIYQTENTDFLPNNSIDNDPAVPGDVRIVDQLTEDTDGDGILDSGDGVIDLKDRTFIGNPNPDFVYGFNINFKYKRLTVRALFNGVYGNDIANGNLLQLDNAEGFQFRNIIPRAYNNAWRPDNQSNSHPRIGYNTINDAAITDRIIEDGSYLRLNNLTIGVALKYTLFHARAQSLQVDHGAHVFRPFVLLDKSVRSLQVGLFCPIEQEND